MGFLFLWPGASCLTDPPTRPCGPMPTKTASNMQAKGSRWGWGSTSAAVLSGSLTTTQEDVCDWDRFYLPFVSLKKALMGNSFAVKSQHFPSVKIDYENGQDRTLLWFKLLQITLITSSRFKTTGYGTWPGAMDAQQRVPSTLSWCNSEYQQ